MSEIEAYKKEIEALENKIKELELKVPLTIPYSDNYIQGRIETVFDCDWTDEDKENPYYYFHVKQLSDALKFNNLGKDFQDDLPRLYEDYGVIAISSGIEVMNEYNSKAHYGFNSFHRFEISNELAIKAACDMAEIRNIDYFFRYIDKDVLSNNDFLKGMLSKQEYAGYVLEMLPEHIRMSQDTLNFAREYLITNKWKWAGRYNQQLCSDAKEALLKYDAQEVREKELQSKLSDLDKLQAQKRNSNNQTKTEVKSRKKI